METRLKNMPINDERRLGFDNPEDLRMRFEQYPLDKDFVDWVRNNGYKIYYNYALLSGQGRICFARRLIEVGFGEEGTDSQEVNLSLLHELVHISVPDSRLSTFHRRSKIYGEYERVIENVAEKLLGLEGFLDYVKKTVPNILD